MPEGVYAGCVGVSKNMLNGIGKLSKVSTTKFVVDTLLNFPMCAGETEMFC